jgi:hypothetical protein
VRGFRRDNTKIRVSMIVDEDGTDIMRRPFNIAEKIANREEVSRQRFRQAGGSTGVSNPGELQLEAGAQHQSKRRSQHSRIFATSLESIISVKERGDKANEASSRND